MTKKKNAFEHIVGYNDNGVIRPLYFNISQLPSYTKRFKKNDEQLVKNNKVWKTVKKVNKYRF